MHQLIDLLKKDYKPRCIAPNEDPIAAHRYAAQVELAQKIVRMVERDPDHDTYEN